MAPESAASTVEPRSGAWSWAHGTEIGRQNVGWSWRAPRAETHRPGPHPCPRFLWLAGHQCLKWRSPVKTMAMPCSLAAAMTSSSRIEPPGWMTSVAPAATAPSRPSGNGKKASRRVRPAHGPAGGLLGGDAPGVPAVLLAGADAHGLAVLHQHDGVGADPGAPAATPAPGRATRRRWGAVGDHRPGRPVDAHRVGRLHEQAAVDGPHLRGPAAPGGGGLEHPEVLLGRQHLQRAVLEARGDDHLGEHGGQRLGQRDRHGPFTATMPPKAETGSHSWARRVGGGEVARPRPRRRGWRA